jgi:hypothetical protein
MTSLTTWQYRYDVFNTIVYIISNKGYTSLPRDMLSLQKYILMLISKKSVNSIIELNDTFPKTKLGKILNDIFRSEWQYSAYESSSIDSTFLRYMQMTEHCAIGPNRELISFAVSYLDDMLESKEKVSKEDYKELLKIFRPVRDSLLK